MSYKFHAIKRKGGLYEARYWARFSDGTKKLCSLYDRDKNNLKKRYLEASAIAIMGKSKKRGGETLAEFLVDWLPNIKEIKDSTRGSYDSVIRKHILPRIGSKPVSEIDLRVFQKLVDDIIASGNTARTAELAKWILSKALRRARKLELTSHYIDARDVEIPKHIPKEREIWNADELRRFFGIIKGDKYEWFYMLAATYGLRRGETIPIEWSDINWDANTVIINKQYIKVYREYKVLYPKTDKSIRVLPLLPHIKLYLEKINPLHDKTGLVMPIDNEYAKPDSVSKHLKKMARDNGLPIVVFHSLRHSVATLLKDAGVPVRDTQAILGHSTPQTTLKFYQHSDLQEKLDGLTRYCDLMGF